MVDGPPFYFSQLMVKHKKRAWRNAKWLSRHVDTLILDHHRLRCEEGLSWLNRLSFMTGHRVIYAADFMERPRCLLQDRGAQLYEDMPVPDGWSIRHMPAATLILAAIGIVEIGVHRFCI